MQSFFWDLEQSVRATYLQKDPQPESVHIKYSATATPVFQISTAEQQMLMLLRELTGKGKGKEKTELRKGGR